MMENWHMEEAFKKGWELIMVFNAISPIGERICWVSRHYSIESFERERDALLVDATKLKLLFLSIVLEWDIDPIPF